MCKKGQNRFLKKAQKCQKYKRLLTGPKLVPNKGPKRAKTGFQKRPNKGPKKAENKWA